MFTSTAVCWVFQRCCFVFGSSLSVDTHDSASELFSLASLILIAVSLAVYVLILAVYFFRNPGLLTNWWANVLSSQQKMFDSTTDTMLLVQLENFVWNIWSTREKQRRNCCYCCSCLLIFCFKNIFNLYLFSNNSWLNSFLEKVTQNRKHVFYFLNDFVVCRKF